MEPPAALKSALESRFCPLQTTHPGLLRFGKTKKQSPFLRFDQRWHLDGFIGEVPHRSGHFSGKVREYKTTGLSGTPVAGETMDISGFCKITHLLDAYRMLQGNYPVAQHPALPSPGKKSAKVYGKLHDPHNQAYVDAVACYMLTKFREADHSPHFSLFYGAYLAIAKEYFYNITEDFSDLRFEKWFWRRKNQGHFKLLGFNGDEPMDADSPLLVSPDEDLDLEESSTEGSDSSSEGVTFLSWGATKVVEVEQEKPGRSIPPLLPPPVTRMRPMRQTMMMMIPIMTPREWMRIPNSLRPCLNSPRCSSSWSPTRIPWTHSWMRRM